MANGFFPPEFGQNVSDAFDVSEIDSLMRAIYPQGVPQQPTMQAPDLRFGRFNIPGQAVDTAAIGALQALQGARRPRNFGEGFVQGAIGSLAGARARGMEQRKAEFERKQKEADEAVQTRRSAASTLARQRRIQITPKMRQEAEAAGVFIPSEVSEIPENQLGLIARDRPQLRERDPALSRLTQLQIERLEAEAAAGMQPHQRARSAAINTIMDNVRQDPDIRDFIVIRDQRRVGMKSGNTSAGDIILMRALARASDPQTGVREEEFRTFQGAQGALDAIGVRLGPELIGEGRLNEKGRKFLRDELENIYQGKKTQHLRAVSTYRSLAAQQGLDPNLVVRDFVGPEDGNEFDAVRQQNAPKPARPR